MGESDRQRWDERYAAKAPPSLDSVGPPGVFAGHAREFPTAGTALDLACGQGTGSVWLALRGLHVLGLDISAVAVAHARELARRAAVADRCRFDVVDLDNGLPAGAPADVILCCKFRDRRLDRAIIERLAPGGLLAIAALSEVGASAGPFRAAPGELTAAFAELTPIAAGEERARPGCWRAADPFRTSTIWCFLVGGSNGDDPADASRWRRGAMSPLRRGTGLG